jgi:hypothetical protein
MKILGVVFLAALVISLGFAAAPIGTVSSSAPFVLRGSPVPVAGVPSWPVVVGDEISTDTSPATFNLRDGSVITLDKGSRTKIEQEDGNVIFRLHSGAMQFNIPETSTVRIANRNTPVPVQRGVLTAISTKPGSTHFLLRPPPPPPPDPISGR